MPASLSRGDRDLLTLLQDRFPLVPAPFAALAERLMWREQEVLSRVWALKARGPLRQISAIFDTQRLGYDGTLVALAVEPGRLEEVGVAISRHPGVSHNYGREHTYNLWFTLAVPPGADLGREVEALARRPGVRRCLSLPTLRTYKINVRFDLGVEMGGEKTPHPRPLSHGERGVAAAMGPVLRHAVLAPELLHEWLPSPRGRGDGGEGPLPTAEIPYVRALQEDLPLTSRPFLVLARRFRVQEGALLAAGGRLLAGGIMRRYGATLRHRQAGYTANAMACWQVPEERIVAAGEAAAMHPAVSHCYQRLAHPPEWPYQLFTMIHCRSDEDLARVVGELNDWIQPQRMAVLPTVIEFKKARLRYFEENGQE